MILIRVPVEFVPTGVNLPDNSVQFCLSLMEFGLAFPTSVFMVIQFLSEHRQVFIAELLRRLFNGGFNRILLVAQFAYAILQIFDSGLMGLDFLPW